MKTDDLITMLASGNVAVDDGPAWQRLVMAIGWGLAGSLLIMMVLLGVREDLSQAAQLPMFWAKMVIPAIAALAALHLAQQLSTPGMRPSHTPKILLLIFFFVESSAAFELMSAPTDMRQGMVFVGTWKTCALNIAILSIPLLAASLWAMNGLAPTRPEFAGAIAGLLAGTTAATIYSLHCPEMTAAFLGIWYMLGIAVPTVAGFVLGGRILRW